MSRDAETRMTGQLIKDCLRTAIAVSFIGSSSAVAQTWEVVDLGTTEIVEAPTVIFGPDGLIAVDSRCNRLVGGATINGNTIVMDGPMAATKMACPEELMQQEDALSRLFSGTISLTYDPFVGTLMLEANDKTARLRPVPSASSD